MRDGFIAGVAAKAVGLVFMALAGARCTEVRREIYGYDRETFKFVVAQTALDMLRRTLNVTH